MDLEIKNFEALTIEELYAILQLRSEVFVVEQDCVYQDIDGKDFNALHVLGWKNSQLIAYTRCFGPGDYFKEASIGRVIIKQSYRGHSLGFALMHKSIEVVYDQFGSIPIKVSAQTYLSNFYQSLDLSQLVTII